LRHRKPAHHNARQQARERVPKRPCGACDLTAKLLESYEHDDWIWVSLVFLFGVVALLELPFGFDVEIAFELNRLCGQNIWDKFGMTALQQILPAD
jgi:hypothetical protein